MIVIGDTLVIKPSSMILEQPKRWLRLYDYPLGRIDAADINGGTLPILSVESPSMHVYLPAETQGILMRDVDSDTGEDVSKEITDASTKEERIGKGQVQAEPDKNNPGKDEATGEGAGYISGAPGNATAVAQAEALYQENTTGVGIKLNITTLLDPQLFPGDVISVQGVSAKHDMNYFILKANYALGTNGADMQIECSNNASALKEVVSAFDATAPQGVVNDQVPDELDSQSVQVTPEIDSGEQSSTMLDALSGGGLE